MHATLTLVLKHMYIRPYIVYSAVQYSTVQYTLLYISCIVYNVQCTVYNNVQHTHFSGRFYFLSD
jgi:hypothetical protein